MYRYTDLRTLHLEITQRCNAACPQCSRFTVNGTVKPNLPLAELTVDDVRGILPPELVKQLTLIYLSGNYGDPAVGKDTLPVLDYFRKSNPNIRLNVHSNASVRDTQWWGDLAHLADSCIFGIDGLEDTHTLYRVGTNWNRIMANAAAYIAAGGNAQWQFLVFKHNEHQVEQAKRLSVEMGFRRFFVKSTSRLYRAEAGREMPRPVARRSKLLGYSLQPASQTGLRNAQVVQLESMTQSKGAYDKYVVETEIKCKATSGNSFYLSAEGFVLPCCWMASIYQEGKKREESEVGSIIAALPQGFSSINAKVHPVAEIIQSNFFQNIVPASWLPRSRDRLKVCAKNCGTCDVQSGQYSSM